MTRLLLGLTVLFASGPAVLAQPNDLDGFYAVAGTNPDGSSYVGTLELKLRDQIWTLQWTMEPPAIGIGLLDGNVLSVMFQTGNGDIGLAACRVDRSKPDITIVCAWTVPGANQISSETLTRIAGSEAPKPQPHAVKPAGRQVVVKFEN